MKIQPGPGPGKPADKPLKHSRSKTKAAGRSKPGGPGGASSGARPDSNKTPDDSHQGLIARLSRIFSRSGADWIRGLVLAGAALIIYFPSFPASFHLDDWQIIVANHYLKDFNFRPGSILKAAFQDGGNNRPLVNISLALNYYFNGARPLGFHLVNFLILVLTGLGVWAALRRLLSRLGYQEPRAGLAAWLAALVWVAHPLDTQAITYIVQRYASLAGAFSIWSIYFFHCGSERKGRARGLYLCSALAGLFAMLCKETALTLAALLLAYRIYFFDRFQPGWLKRNAKWMAALAGFYLLAAFLIFRPGMVKTLSSGFLLKQIHPGQRLLTEARVLIWYPLEILFPFPQHLSVFHDFSASQSLVNPISTALSFALILALIAAAVYLARTRPAFSFAVIWYFVLLLVEALPLPIEFASEHRLYLASLAIIAPATAWPILKLNKYKRAAAAIIAIAVLLGGFSRHRNRVWRSEESLWRDTIAKAPSNPRAWLDYCSALAAADNCRRALPVCQKAMALVPSDAGTHNNLGMCYKKMGELESAEKELMKAASLSPDQVSVPLVNLANLYRAKKDYAGAAKWYAAALERDPANAQAHYDLAIIYNVLKREAEAMRELEEALHLNPGLSEARFYLAQALAVKGKCPEARDLIQKAPAGNPQFSEILDYCAGQE